jgi:hypothetical protein
MSRAAVLGLCSVSLLLFAAPAGAKQARPEVFLTIRLVSKTQSSRVVDRAPKHEINKGDVVYALSFLYNQAAQFGRPKGALVGYDRALDTFLSRTRARVSVQVTLPDGGLKLAGEVSRTTAPVIRVVGGTGRYAHVRGTCSERDPKNGPAINVYRLQLP